MARQSTNLLSIHKEMLKAGEDTRAKSLISGAMGAFALNVAEQEKKEAMMDKTMEDLGGIQNIVKIPQEQRGAVEEFLRTNRDEYASLAEQYMKTKDPAIKDKMNAIKYKFENLNNQLDQYATNKAEYMSDYEEGNLMKGGSFAKDNNFFLGMYGDPNNQFAIDDNGEISFTVDGETKSLKDAGTHTLRNFEGEKYADDLFLNAADLKWKGGYFDKGAYSRNFVNQHKSISKNDLSALLQSDLSGDGDKPSFMDQWSNGELADEFYQGVDKENITEEDVNNLLKDKQRGLDLMGKYVGNISQDIYDEGKLSPEVSLDRKAKQAQIDSMNKKSKGDDEDIDLGRKDIKGNWRKDKVVREQIERINNPKKGDILPYGDDVYEWNDEKKGWDDGSGKILKPKQLYDIMDLPPNMYNLSDTGMTEEEINQQGMLGVEDFMQNETNFTNFIQTKYDLDNYIIKDTRDDLGGLFEKMENHITIFDKNTGEEVFRTRTNYTNPENAVGPAGDFNAWLENNNIQTRAKNRPQK
tara:strand:- start:1053 stop:2627 length:1575 start_codon:yes stop_codon:yes gene_type:complete